MQSNSKATRSLQNQRVMTIVVDSQLVCLTLLAHLSLQAHKAHQRPILRQGQIRSPIHLNGENCYKIIKWEKFAAKD